MDVINLYINGFLLIFKIYIHNIRGTVWESLMQAMQSVCESAKNIKILYVSITCNQLPATHARHIGYYQ
jgi:hypothetical protein